MFLGAFTMLVPFMGFPSTWDTIILLVAGVLTIALGIAVRRGNRPRASFPVFRRSESSGSTEQHA